MVKRAVGGHWGLAPKLGKLALDNKIEAYNLPQGVISHMFRDIAAGKPGTITHVGLQTYVDPRLDGGRVNSKTTENIVEVIELDGHDYLRYKHFDIDVCLIRGTTADEFGNISMEQEVAPLDALSQAMATKQRGGIVICQVMRLARGGGINHLFVQIPGILVDYVVLVDMVKEPQLHMQTFLEQYNPYYSGQVQSVCVVLAAKNSAPPDRIPRRTHVSIGVSRRGNGLVGSLWRTWANCGAGGRITGGH